MKLVSFCLKEEKEVVFKMVLDTTDFYVNCTPSTYNEGEKRSAFARQQSFQKMQELDKYGASATSKMGYQSQKPKSNTKQNDYGAWGPAFKNRHHFNEMHNC